MLQSDVTYYYPNQRSSKHLTGKATQENYTTIDGLARPIFAVKRKLAPCEHHRSTTYSTACICSTWWSFVVTAYHGPGFFVIRNIIVKMSRHRGQRFHSTSDSHLPLPLIIFLKSFHDFQIYPHISWLPYTNDPLENIMRENFTGHDAFLFILFHSSV